MHHLFHLHLILLQQPLIRTHPPDSDTDVEDSSATSWHGQHPSSAESRAGCTVRVKPFHLDLTLSESETSTRTHKSASAHLPHTRTGHVHMNRAKPFCCRSANSLGLRWRFCAASAHRDFLLNLPLILISVSAMCRPYLVFSHSRDFHNGSSIEKDSVAKSCLNPGHSGEPFITSGRSTQFLLLNCGQNSGNCLVHAKYLTRPSHNSDCDDSDFFQEVGFKSRQSGVRKVG